MSTCRHGAPLIMAALLTSPAGAQVRVTTQWLFPVETVYAADFVPFSVGQQPDFLGITLMNGAASPQSVVLQLIVRQERPSSRLLFEGITDPFVLRGSVRRITNRDLASQNSDVSIKSYDIASAAEDLAETVARTGRFPSGTYVFQTRVTMPGGMVLDEDEVRVDLVNPTRLELLTPGRPFGDQPEVVNASAPRFQWSTDEGLVGGSQQYRIRVVPANASASPEEAMQGFASWEAVTSATTAIYPGSVSAIPLVPGNTYAWQVTRDVLTSGGTQLLDSPIYWFKMAGGTGEGSTGGGAAADVGRDTQLYQLLQRLGLGGDLAGFRPTGQILVDGSPVSIENLEALLRAILSGDVAVRTITVR